MRWNSVVLAVGIGIGVAALAAAWALTRPAAAPSAPLPRMTVRTVERHRAIARVAHVRITERTTDASDGRISGQEPPEDGRMVTAELLDRPSPPHRAHRKHKRRHAKHPRKPKEARIEEPNPSGDTPEGTLAGDKATSESKSAPAEASKPAAATTSEEKPLGDQ